MLRYRFKTKSVEDWRPLIDLKDIGMPYWCSGEGGCGSDSYAIIICYLPNDEDLLKYWDDAYDIDVQYVDDIEYSSRFPKPEYLK